MKGEYHGRPDRAGVPAPWKATRDSNRECPSYVAPCLVHLEHRTDILDLLDKRIKSVVGLHERSLVTRGSVRYQERRHHSVQFRSGEFDCVCLSVHDSILHDPPSPVKLL